MGAHQEIKVALSGIFTMHSRTEYPRICRAIRLDHAANIGSVQVQCLRRSHWIFPGLDSGRLNVVKTSTKERISHTSLPRAARRITQWTT